MILNRCKGVVPLVAESHEMIAMSSIDFSRVEKNLRQTKRYHIGHALAERDECSADWSRSLRIHGVLIAGIAAVEEIVSLLRNKQDLKSINIADKFAGLVVPGKSGRR